MSVHSMHTTSMLSLLALLVSGCGGTQRRGSNATDARARARVAVLPSAWATETQVLDIDPSASLAAGLEAHGTMEATRGPAIVAALDGRAVGDCAEDTECVRAVGEQLSVDHVAALRLASLGTTVMIRVRLMEVASGAAETARQTVVQAATAARVDAAVRAIGRELADPPDAHRERWYSKWWFWTLVGGAVAGGAAATIVVAVQPGSRNPDFVITPP